MSDFVVIDFETANPDIGSICQIGIVTIKDNAQKSEWVSFINPEDYFDDWNIAIHGITENTVKKSPTFPDVYKDVRGFLEGKIVISHGWFDLGCIRKALEKYNLKPIKSIWIDSTKIARRSLPEYAKKGYGLQNLAKHFALKTQAHDALDDAKTCAVIVNNLLSQTNTKIDDWIDLIKKPLGVLFANDADEGFHPNPEGKYFGNSIVFTGELSIVRREAQKLASQYGFAVQDGVRKDSDFIVVGVQDPNRLKGKEKSAKQVKAERLISKGLPIKVLSEVDFLKICS